MSARRHSQRGFILVPVLWVLALLALATALLTRTVANEIRATSNLLTRAEGENLADGVARLAIRYLQRLDLDGTTLGTFSLDGTPQSCSVAESAAVVSIASTEGLVNLNTAPLDVLEALFTGAGAADPKALAAAVADFRDGDSVATPEGAEAPAYAAAGLAYGPKNAPFATVDELDQVLGMTGEVLQRVRPFVTTESRLANPDASVTPAELKATGVSSMTASGSGLRNVVIRVTVRKDGAARAFTREALVLREDRLRGRILMKQWARSEMHLPAAPAPARELPACITELLSVDR